jgi:hypothetical protein
MNIDELMRGLRPSLGPFADTLGPQLTMLLGLVWILCLAGAAALVMKGALEFGASRSSGRPMATSDGAMDIGVPVIALVILGVIPAIVTAIV